MLCSVLYIYVLIIVIYSIKKNIYYAIVTSPLGQAQTFIGFIPRVTTFWYPLRFH